MRIWIDTDIGTDVDDALALAYVLRHPGFELVGVSTVFGDVALRTRIAEKLLDVATPSNVSQASQLAPVAKIPVLCGLGVPLTPKRKGVMFGHEGRGILENPKPRLHVERESQAEQALRIDALADAVASAQPEVLLAIGPLTNLGALLRAGAPLPPLAIMGGKLTNAMLPGMVAHISEWNWYCDPLAVQGVLEAEHRLRPRVVPAEVTFRTRLGDGDVARLAGGDALAQLLSTLCDHWLELQKDRFRSKRPVVALHDPLTAAILVTPDLCPFEGRCIRVDDEGAATKLQGRANIDAAVDVDTAALRDHLMETWLAGS